MSNIFRFITPVKSKPISLDINNLADLTFKKLDKNEVESKKGYNFIIKLANHAAYVNVIP